MHRRRFIHAAAATAFVPSLSNAEPAPRPAAPDAWPAGLVLATVPAEGGANTVERFRGMASHLERVLGLTVSIKSASDYAGVITAMGEGHADLAYLGPKAYIEAASRSGALAIAVELDKAGTPGYRSIILARKDRGFAGVDDLRGRTFAFTDPNSTSGYLVPSMHFAKDLQVEPRSFFAEVRFAGSHQASMLAIANGSVDAGAANELDLDRLLKSGQIHPDTLTVLWRSEVIPGSPMVVRRGLPESLVAGIIGALMMLNDHPDVLEQLGNDGYQYTRDAAYDVTRYLMRLQDAPRGAAPPTLDTRPR